jgi:transposase InsO family protein
MYATQVFRYVTPCTLVSVYRRCVEAFYLDLSKSNQEASRDALTSRATYTYIVINLAITISVLAMKLHLFVSNNTH